MSSSRARVLSTVLLTTVTAALLSLTATAASAFPDVRGSVHAPAVSVLSSQGITEGCEDDRFCPQRDLRRDQLAALIDRAMDLPQTDGGQFDDLDSTLHGDAIERVAAAGITLGCEDGRFCPRDEIPRGQFATMLDRAFDLEDASATYFADGGFHADAVDRLGASGVSDGCGSDVTRFCSADTLTRAQSATFLARAMELVDRVEPRTLADREAEQVAAQQASSRFPDQVWDDLAQCESGGNWEINTGNGFYGGLQFHPDTWRSVGGSGLPHEHSREEQIRRADTLQERSGWGQWPHCSEQLGLS